MNHSYQKTSLHTAMTMSGTNRAATFEAMPPSSTVNLMAILRVIPTLQ
jgi:hypothetical protein